MKYAALALLSGALICVSPSVRAQLVTITPAQGPVGLTGTTGNPGANGNTIYNGSGAPGAGLGVNGDFYLDTTGKLIYGPKTGSGWGSGTSIVGSQGVIGMTGPAGPSAVGTANARTLSPATAYQATDTTKPSIVTASLTSTATISLSGGQTNTATVYVGTTSGVATTGGIAVCGYSNTNTGALTIGLNLSTVATTPCTFALPIGGFFAFRVSSGTVTASIAVDSSLG